MDTRKSESYVSLKLSEIHRRFAELMEEEISELRLEDPVGDERHHDPYNKVAS